MTKNHFSTRFVPRLAIVLAFASALFAQSTTNKTLVVNGKTAGAIVRDIDGRSFVDLETLAQAMNGTFAASPTRVVLTIPGANSAPASAAPSQPLPAPAPIGLSRNFASSAIGVIADMREWLGAVRAMITYGGAMSPALAQEYAQRAQISLAQAAVAATTDDDRNALGLLQNGETQLGSWSNGVISAQKTMNGGATLDPNALGNDPAFAKIEKCDQFLNSMLVSGTYSDDGSCH